MNKNNYKYLIYILLTLFFIFLFVINEYLFGNTLYCDSNINPNDLVESLNNNKPQEKVYCKIEINCFGAFTNYKNIAKRKILWYACYKNKGNFNSYENFKECWDPNTRVFKEIKEDLKNEIKDELHKMFLIKRTLNWIFKSSNPGGGKGL